MDIDDVYKEIGEFGFYQKKIFWTFSFCQAALTLQQVHNVFVGAEPQFYCQRGTGKDKVAIMGCPIDEGPCDKYIFPGDDFTSTVSEFNLVCADGYKSDLAQSCVMLGILFGSLVFGYLADKYGRRKIVCVSPLCITAVTLLGIFSPTYSFYLLMRLLAGMFCGSLGMIGFVLITEVIGQSKRGFVGMVLPMCFAFSLGTYSLMAYYIRDWKILSALTALPMLVGIYMYWLFPESPRWLYSQGRVDEAERILEMIAYKNNGHLPNKTILLKRDEDSEPPVQPSILEIARHPLLRSMTLNNAFTWFVNCAVYYGLTLGVGNLGADLYMSVAMSALVEIPAYLLAYFLIERIGRRWTYSSSMLAGGLCCLVITVIPAFNYKTRMTLAICGKMGISMSFCVAWLYAAEMYPTNIRNKALSICNMMARLGGIVCPMIIAFGKTHKNMDFLLLGLMTFVAGIVCLKLPETLGKPMPETVEDLQTAPSRTRSHKVNRTHVVSPPNLSEEKLKLLQDEIESNQGDV